MRQMDWELEKQTVQPKIRNAAILAGACPSIQWVEGTKHPGQAASLFQGRPTAIHIHSHSHNLASAVHLTVLGLWEETGAPGGNTHRLGESMLLQHC